MAGNNQSGKGGCAQWIVGFIVIAVAVSVWQSITGDMGSGVKRPEYDGNRAVIKVDNYNFKDGTSIGLQNLASALVQAAKHDGTERIFIEVEVDYEDQYGNDSTEVHRSEFTAISLDELRKYRTGKDFYDRVDLGLGLVYESIIMSDDNIVSRD
jgi:hypothetical protein